MDTGTHLRAIWRRRVPVLLLALLAAAAVFGLRSAATVSYRAQADLYLVQGSAGQNDDAEVSRLTALYAEFVRDPRVVADLLRRSRLPVRPADVQDLVTVTSPEAGQLTVVAEQPTAARAAALADATGEALSAGAAKDQAEAQKVELEPLTGELTALRTQLAQLPDGDPGRELLQARLDRADQARVDRLSAVRARLDLVRRAQADDALRAPRPTRDATLAFLLVLVLAAEAAALLAARRKGLEGGDPVPSLEAWSGLPVFRTGAGPHGPDESGTSARFLRKDAAGRPVYLIGLTPAPSTDDALERVAAAVATQGAATPRVALLPEGAPPPPVKGGKVLTAAPRALPPTALVTASTWTDDRVLALAADAPGACGLVVLARQVRRPELEEALRVLRLAGLAVSCVVVDEATRRQARRT